MAKTIQVRGVPDETHRTLRQRAAAAGVSLSDYLLAELVRISDRPEVSDVLRLAAGRSGGVERDTLVDAVRSGRDRE